MGLRPADGDEIALPAWPLEPAARRVSFDRAVRQVKTESGSAESLDPFFIPAAAGPAGTRKVSHKKVKTLLGLFFNRIRKTTPKVLGAHMLKLKSGSDVLQKPRNRNPWPGDVD
jgi:hypothetical protein